jgi:hypothetical protein
VSLRAGASNSPGPSSFCSYLPKYMEGEFLANFAMTEFYEVGLEAWPKTQAPSVVPEPGIKRQSCKYAANRDQGRKQGADMYGDNRLGVVTSRMSPVLIPTSVRLATLAAIRSWKSVFARPT